MGRRRDAMLNIQANRHTWARKTDMNNVAEI
jgi:hypothetical protein